jgi:hypothetical protein
MHMTMISASYGKGVHQGCPSKEGGLRLIQFESPMWRPKTSHTTTSTTRTTTSNYFNNSYNYYFLWDHDKVLRHLFWAKSALYRVGP